MPPVTSDQPRPLYTQFAAMLRELMEVNEISGAELGRRLGGTDKSLVSRWRRGIDRPEAETVARIADIFGVDQDLDVAAREVAPR